jgi:hypothetical protein
LAEAMERCSHRFSRPIRACVAPCLICRVWSRAASPFLVKEGVAERCEVVGGDIFTAVPPGGDLYLLCHNIHDWDDLRATRVLQACRSAMTAQAKPLFSIGSCRSGSNPAQRCKATLLDLTMMVRTGGGRERTAGELQALLTPAGLRLERIIPMRIPDSLVEATPE